MAPSTYTPPVDLSHLPSYQPNHLQPRTLVFVGRVSTQDHQTPSLSIPGQAASAEAVLRPGEQITAYYWDVESGMLGLDERGQGDGVDGVPLRRDGGLEEFLAAAARREFTAAVCERVDRVARDMYVSLTIERMLRDLGIELLCANEPQSEESGTGNLIVRRTGQMTAEIFRHELMEMSRRGQAAHAAQGFLHGYAPYGYVAVADHNAEPRRGRFGPKAPPRRLELDSDARRPATAATIFQLRHDARCRGSEIARQLNHDHDAHPPIVAPSGTSQGRWTSAQVERILANPKFAGYMAWNRKASRTRQGRANPIAEWVWSPRPTHPNIVDLDTWVRVQEITAELRHPRSPLDRIRQAAAERGLTVEEVRATDHHTLYRVGQALIPLRRGPLPPSAVDALVQEVHQQ